MRDASVAILADSESFLPHAPRSGSSSCSHLNHCLFLLPSNTSEDLKREHHVSRRCTCRWAELVYPTRCHRTHCRWQGCRVRRAVLRSFVLLIGNADID